MKRIEGVFTTRRLLTLPNGHDRYRLELQGELRLALRPQHLVRIDLGTWEEPGELQRSRLRLSSDVGAPPVETVIDYPATRGDCRRLVEMLYPTPSLELFAKVLAPFLQRLPSLSATPAGEPAHRSAA